MLSTKTAPKTMRDLVKALVGLSAQTKIEIYEAETLKDIPPRYRLDATNATVIILT
jgi:hypothetical protein